MTSAEVVKQLCQFLSDDEDEAKPEELLSRVKFLSEEVMRLKEWREVLRDALVVSWCITEENANDPKVALNDLTRQVIRQTLDPMISEGAAELIEEGKRQAREEVGE